jgi:DNA-directed RNA polymerase subunit RPC12/RpoP
MSELITCSRCHSEIEAKYFSLNRKGIRQKCCDNCLAKYQCNLCEYTSSTKYSMNTHILNVHMKLRKYSCPDCGDNFAHSGHLNRHIDTVHKKLRKYECPHCEKKFGHKFNLQQHIKNVHKN